MNGGQQVGRPTLSIVSLSSNAWVRTFRLILVAVAELYLSNAENAVAALGSAYPPWFPTFAAKLRENSSGEKTKHHFREVFLGRRTAGAPDHPRRVSRVAYWFKCEMPLAHENGPGFKFIDEPQESKCFPISNSKVPDNPSAK